MSSIQGFGNNEANTRTKSGSAARGERHMGERRRRLTLPKQRRVGIVRLPLTFPSLISRWDQLRSGALKENRPSTGGRTGAITSSDVMGEHYIRSSMTKCSRQHWFRDEQSRQTCLRDHRPRQSPAFACCSIIEHSAHSVSTASNVTRISLSVGVEFAES